MISSKSPRFLYHLTTLTIPSLKPKFQRFKEYSTRLFKYPAANSLMEPDFIVIGGMKCASTSLHHLVQQHPDVAKSVMKETNHFSNHFRRSLRWYRTNFAPKSSARRHEEQTGRKMITGESSPLYIFHPLAAKRIYEAYPNAKLILVIRNPIDRAWSHFKQMERRKHEPLSFEEALEQEPGRINGEMEKLIAGEIDFSPQLVHFTYLERGKYLNQIKKFHEYFPKEQLMIIKTEDFKQDQKAILDRTCEFLGLSPYEWPKIKSYNVGGYSEKMKPETRQFLQEYFEPHNAALSEYLNKDFNWE